jgi:hypothetical protein
MAASEPKIDCQRTKVEQQGKEHSKTFFASLRIVLFMIRIVLE